MYVVIFHVTRKNVCVTHGHNKTKCPDGLARLWDKRQFVDNLSTFCLLFVLFLSWFCLVFVQDLSQQRQKKLSFVKIFQKKFWICLIFVLKNLKNNKDKTCTNFSRQKSDKSKTFSGKSWQMTIFLSLLWQILDKNKTKPRQKQDKKLTKSRQKVDKLSTNCRLSHSLASPSGAHIFFSYVARENSNFDIIFMKHRLRRGRWGRQRS